MAFAFNDSAAGGFDASQMSSPSASKNRASRNNQVVPIKCAAITNLPVGAETLQLGTFLAQRVCVLGTVTKCEKLEMFNSYEISDEADGTPVRARHWTDNECPQNLFPVGSFVKVVCTIRFFESKPTLNIFKISEVDQSEAAGHDLAVQLAELYYETEYGQPENPAGKLNESSQQMPNAATANNSTVLSDINGPGFAGGFAADSTAGLSRTQTQIFNMIKACTSDQGCRLEEILRKFPGRSAEIRSAIETLSQEGFIYSTVDDETFMPTDA